MGEKYAVCYDISIIDKYFKQLHEQSEQIVVWQKTGDDQKIVVQGNFIEAPVVYESLLIGRNFQTTEQKIFDQSSVVNLYSLDNYFLGQAKVSSDGAEALVLEFPHKILFREGPFPNEQRRYERKIILDLGRAVLIKFMNRFYECPIYDISISGVNFLLSPKVAHKISQGDRVSVIEIFGNIVPGSISLKVQHISDHSDEYVKLGCVFVDKDGHHIADFADEFERAMEILEDIFEQSSTK